MIEKASWIACGTEPALPVIVKKFKLEKKPQSATIEITGLGFFQLYINGKRVSDDLLVPCQSDYSPRDYSGLLYPLSPNPTYRVYYLSYEIGHLLSSGENKFEIMLGNGWYRQTERVVEGKMDYGDRLLARFCAEILTESGKQTVMSDGTESYYLSHIIYSQLFIGEIHDARLANKPHVMKSVELVDGPQGELTLQTCPTDKVIRTVMPDVAAVLDDRIVYDAKEIMSGIPIVHASGPTGSVIRIQYGELLNEDGSINFASTGSHHVCGSGRPQIQEDVFICDGTTTVFVPRFVWHAFRFFSVEGKNCEIVISEVHSNIERLSTFHSPSEGLYYLYSTYMATQLTNMHCGVPSDCPHRERLGYTGDGQVTAEAAMLLLNSKSFYKKWLQDILDCQDKKTGHVTHTAPFMGGGGGPAEWGGAIVEVTYRYWRQYGELDVLQRAYPAMLKWRDYMLTRTDNDLIVREEEKGWCLGDWASMQGPELPEPFVNSCAFVHQLTHLSGMAEVLGDAREAKKIQSQAERIRKAVRRTFYESETGNYCGGRKAANAFALDILLNEDPRTLSNLAEYYDEHPVFDSGFFGTDKLIDVLFQNGYADVAYKILTNREKGTFLYLKDQKASTLWEYFDGRGSHCHPAFGACVRSLFRHILGIRQNPGSCGYQSVYIEPKIPKKLDSASGSIVTPEGPIVVSWRIELGQLIAHIKVPQSAHAEFRLQGTVTPLHGGDNRLELALPEEP
ncbi:MAG: family 78 glycoside hydrolase catalytic domain [Clostridia bacterium]|nr:family 78 glycoside hydrolase catalytic domain [Clostridia bacterium]